MILKEDYSISELHTLIENAENKHELNEYIMLLAFKLYVPFMGVSFEELLINLNYQPVTQLQTENMQQILSLKHKR